MRVVICEDSVLLRAGLERLLRADGHEVAASLPDASGLIESVDSSVDLALLDVRMPPTHTDEGVRAAVALRKRFPHVAILLLSQYVEHAYAADLVAQHPQGLGYLLKDRVADVDDFLADVQKVAAGGTVLDPEVVQQILVRTRRSQPLFDLTPREKQVLGLMAEGRSNAAIAAALKVSPGSVEKHVSAILLKLDIPNTPDENRRVLAVLRYLES
ncbi:two-component system response regulator [Actinomycetales bacterium JB111]|nr:two-component system response regulator [Actinomycetales bacterium JB111]